MVNGTLYRGFLEAPVTIPILTGPDKIAGCYQSLNARFTLVHERNRKTYAFDTFDFAEQGYRCNCDGFLKNTAKFNFQVIVVSKQSNWERSAFCLVIYYLQVMINSDTQCSQTTLIFKFCQPQNKRVLCLDSQ